MVHRGARRTYVRIDYHEYVRPFKIRTHVLPLSGYRTAVSRERFGRHYGFITIYYRFTIRADDLLLFFTMCPSQKRSLTLYIIIMYYVLCALVVTREVYTRITVLTVRR